MKHKKEFRIVIFVLGIVIAVLAFSLAIICYLFFTQYNYKGMSRGGHLSINKDVGVMKVGNDGKFEVYTYQLEDVYLIDVAAHTHSLTEAISDSKIVVNDMIKKLKKGKESNGFKIYKAENYQIILKEKVCIIAPLEIDFDEMEALIE